MDLWFRVSPLSARRGIFGIAQEPLSLPPENSRHHHGHNAASQRQLFTGSSSNRLNSYLLFILKEDFEEPPILLWTWVDQPWFSLHRLVWGNYSARQRAVHLPTHSHLMNHDLTWWRYKLRSGLYLTGGLDRLNSSNLFSFGNLM